MSQNFKIRAYFMQHFVDLDMKKISRSQNCNIWGMEPKSWFRATSTKSLWQRTYQAKSPET